MSLPDTPLSCTYLGRVTDFVAKRHRTMSDLATWWTPLTEYGEFEGLRLPVRGKAIWKLASGDLEYIGVTVTDLHYDVATNGRSPRQ